MPPQRALIGMSREDGGVQYIRVGNLRQSSGSVVHPLEFWGATEQRIAGLIAIGNLAGMAAEYISRPDPQFANVPYRWPAPGRAAIAATQDEVLQAARDDDVDLVAIYIRPDWTTWRVFPLQTREALDRTITVARRARGLMGLAGTALHESENAPIRRQPVLRADARDKLRQCTKLLRTDLDRSAMGLERWRGIVEMIDCRRELSGALRKGAPTVVTLEHVTRAERQLSHGLEMVWEMRRDVIRAGDNCPDGTWTVGE